MTLAKYAHTKGYTLEQFEELKQTVAANAAEILNAIKARFNPDSGIYYPTADILDVDGELAPYILKELRGAGVEFIENGAMFKY